MEEERERSLGTRAYARVAYERCVSRSAGMKWLSLNFPAPRAHASVKYQPFHTCHYHHGSPDSLFASLSFLCGRECSGVTWLGKMGSKGRYFTASGNPADTGGKKRWVGRYSHFSVFLIDHVF